MMGDDHEHPGETFERRRMTRRGVLRGATALSPLLTSPLLAAREASARAGDVVGGSAPTDPTDAVAAPPDPIDVVETDGGDVVELTSGRLTVEVRLDPFGVAFRRAGGRPDTVEGGRYVTVDAPLDEIPLFVRSGTCLELLPPDVETLADVDGEDGDVVSLADVEGERRRLCFPRAGRPQ